MPYDQVMRRLKCSKCEGNRLSVTVHGTGTSPGSIGAPAIFTDFGQLPTAFDNHYAPLWYRPMTGSATVYLLHAGYI